MFKISLAFPGGSPAFMDIYNAVLQNNQMNKSVDETGKPVFKMIGTTKNPITYKLCKEYPIYTDVVKGAFFWKKVVSEQTGVNKKMVGDIYLIKANTVFLKAANIEDAMDAVRVLIEEFNITASNRTFVDPEDLIKSITKE